MRELLVERNKKCVVLSIGSNNDFDFERGIQKEFPTCAIHTYDHTITPENVPPQVNFHSLGLASKNSDKLKSFATLLSDLNLTDEHSIEVLKLDIEGYGKNFSAPNNNRMIFLTRHCRMGGVRR